MKSKLQIEPLADLLIIGPYILTKFGPGYIGTESHAFVSPVDAHLHSFTLAFSRSGDPSALLLGFEINAKRYDNRVPLNLAKRVFADLAHPHDPQLLDSSEITGRSYRIQFGGHPDGQLRVLRSDNTNGRDVKP